MSCEVCGMTTNLKSCGSCLQVNYCSREHQIAHWKEHKPWCKGHSVASSSNALSNGQPVNGGAIDDLIVSSSSSQSSSQSNEPVRNSNHSNDSHLVDVSHRARPVPGPANSNILCTSNFSLQNAQMRSDATIAKKGNADSQICPSMASLRVCDSSSSGQFVEANAANSAADSYSSHNVMPTDLSTNRDAVFNNLNTYCQIILKDMNQYGFCVIDNFLQNGEAIMTEVKNLYSRGLFRAGQVVNNRTNSNTKMIRGDQIIWVEGNEPICNNIGFLIRILDSIITKCNTTMSAGEFLKYTITRRTKAMIACYPGNNTKYVRHIDNPNSDGRCITSIYYLNKDYEQQNDGGVLRLFPQMNDGIVANIEPKFNRVIFFWSDRRNPHEVMPSARMRFAITVWYFDANERAKAIQKYKENSLQCPNDKDLAPF